MVPFKITDTPESGSPEILSVTLPLTGVCITDKGTNPGDASAFVLFNRKNDERKRKRKFELLKCLKDIQILSDDESTIIADSFLYEVLKSRRI